MKINKNNYEAFFLDYHEGNLTPLQVANLLIFVEQHPHLKEELESFENFSVDDFPTVEFENKSRLKKEITPDNKEEYFIRCVEKTLSPVETNLLNDFLIQHPPLVVELELYLKTKLSPDTSIIFENKEKLKQHTKKAIPFYYYISVAATILLLLGFFFLVNNKSIESEFAEIPTTIKNNTSKSLVSSLLIENKTKKINSSPIMISPIIVKKEKSKEINSGIQDSLLVSPDENLNLPITLIQEKANTLDIVSDSLFVESQKSEQVLDNSYTIAQVDKKSETENPREFLSFGELAVEKIKEKLWDKNAVSAQKKTGRLKKISAWDLVQVITSGISKITGREVEIKPYYNDEGLVTAYAFNAGAIQISRGR